MKTTSTIVCNLLVATFMIFSFTSIKAQTCTAPAMLWDNAVLISGTALQKDAVYKFPSVTPGVYAKVTITNLVNGASLVSIDDLTYGYNAAWQPIVKTPATQVASDSYVSFKIEFKDEIDDKNHKYDCFQLSFIDIDGDNNHIREFIAAKEFNDYTVSNSSSLTMTELGGGITQATGSLPDYPGLDTSAYITNINFRYTNKEKVNEVRVGTRVDATHNVANRYSCGYFAPVSMPAGLMPVKYSSFDAVAVDKTVTLNWITESEINNSHFEVERSLDGTNFTTISLVLDGFENGAKKSYQYKDNATELKSKSIVYYRLKQIDNNGKITYTNILVVKLQAKGGVTIETAPNPFTENLNVRFTTTETGTAVINIISSNGQKILSRQSLISKGYNNLQLNGLSQIAPGVYVAQVFINGVISGTQKIIKN